ncbi:MAG: aminotransferase class I/II-fold pyridoxal phosphate-dependent enzyme [Bacteroidota bacterium]
MIQPASRMDLVKEYYFSTKLKEIAEMNANGHAVLNLGIGSPDLAPSENTISALTEAASNPKNHAYQSYVGVPALRKAFADWYQKYFKVELNPANEILPLLGSKEGIMHISMAYLEAGDEVLIPNPGYPTYRSASLLAGATLVEYNLAESNGWLPDLEALEATDLSKVKLMWLNYPHMPTGAKATKSFFQKLVVFAKKHNIMLVNDNPYSFILNDDYLSILAIEGANEIALELNSLSKAQNMAGWRVGMMAGSSELIANVLRFKSNMDSGMFLPVQLAAIEALKADESWYRSLNEIYKIRQQKVFEVMDLIGCQYDTQQTGMFVWAKIPEKWTDAYQLSDEILYKAKVFITPGGIFGSQGNRYLRISLCADISLFQESIERIQQRMQ